jgi:hypothetical protein
LIFVFILTLGAPLDYFWALFSQTHLVSQIPRNIERDRKKGGGSLPVGHEGADFVDEERPLGPAGVLDALLDHVGRELVLRQRQHLAADGGNDFRFVFLKNK